MPKFSTPLNIGGVVLSLIGGCLMFWVGQRSGPNPPYLDDDDFSITKEMAKHAKFRSRINAFGFGLIVIGAFMQLVAVSLAN